MPLQQLVQHFNERFHAERGVEIPPLRIKDGSAEGVWGSARIGSRFAAIRRLDAPQTLIGHIARSHVYAADGIGPRDAESLCAATPPEHIVDFDRLRRTVHLLNYLPLSHLDGFVLVDVSPRHVLSVPGDHGAYFEEIIYRCGLPPRRIVISVTADTVTVGQRPTLFAGLRNYKHRGYRIAVNLTRQNALGRDIDRVFGVSPDYLTMDAQGQFGSVQNRRRVDVEKLRALVKAISALGGETLLTGIDTQALAEAMLEAGVKLGQGRYFDGAGGLKQGHGG